MADTLSTLTRQLDDDFTNTWYDIQARAVDNILDATVVTLALKEFGCMNSQPGGEFGWTDTIRYGTKSTQRFKKGSTVTQEVKKLDTFVHLDWRFFCVDVNRSLADDNKNYGKYQNKSYLQARLEAARNAMVQDLETYICQWGAYYAAPEQPNGLYDICAPSTAVTTGGDGSDSDSYSSGTSNGNCNRTNTWWRNWVAYSGASLSRTNKTAASANTPYALNLVPDMDNFYNCVGANQEFPNFILTKQEIYEVYMEEVRDRQQIVRTGFDRRAADLGFDTCTFRGATMAWSSKITSNHVMMLNMNRVKWNYHPNVWFDMTEWRHTVNQFERVAYIVCMTPGLATNEPRRHGVMLYSG